jgi:hypothetical protein
VDAAAETGTYAQRERDGRWVVDDEEVRETDGSVEDRLTARQVGKNATWDVSGPRIIGPTRGDQAHPPSPLWVVAFHPSLSLLLSSLLILPPTSHSSSA